MRGRFVSAAGKVEPLNPVTIDNSKRVCTLGRQIYLSGFRGSCDKIDVLLFNKRNVFLIE